MSRIYFVTVVILGITVTVQAYFGVRFRCVENKNFVGSDHCDLAPSILACVRRWNREDSNLTVSFMSKTWTCCYSNRSPDNHIQLTNSGSTLCSREFQTATTTTTTTFPSATTQQTASIVSTTVIIATPTTTGSSTPASTTSSTNSETPSSTTTTPFSTTEGTTTIVETTPSTTKSDSATTTGVCREGWTLISSKCFKHINSVVPWMEAQARCQSMQANLAHVYLPSDLIAFVNILTCPAGTPGCEPWLGINDKDEEEVFIGAAGQTVSAAVVSAIFGNKKNKDCSYLHPENEKLYFWDCSGSDSFICESNLI